MPVLFQSTHSLRSATLAHSGHRKRAVFQSTHSLRSATTADRLAQMVCDVSIHALLAECDILLHIRLGWPLQSFNPRTPCGVRLFLFPCTRTPTQFQSTHSLRSATQKNARLGQLEQVSIHALLAECDTETGEWSCSQLRFQSTHSLRSATEMDRRLYDKVAVSIHALLAECDKPGTGFLTWTRCFNPRTPCGVRPVGFSTDNAGRAVSIHALLAECDSTPRKALTCADRFQSTHSLRSATDHGKRSLRPLQSFNPRTPCGVRLFGFTCFRLGIIVSIHALLAECDCWSSGTVRPAGVSIHALLAECDKRMTFTTPDMSPVSIHALLAECDTWRR